MKPSMLQTFGLSTTIIVGYVVAYSLTYRKALKNGENSVAMTIIGRQGCLFMSKLLNKLARLNPERMRERLREEGLEAIHLAIKDTDSQTSGSICLVGSSTFTFWANFKRDLTPLRCVNFAFGGSTTTDLLPHVATYASIKPKIVVYYCGANDLSFGRGEQLAAKGFVDFAEALRKLLPNVGILYLSISLTPLQTYAGNAQRVKDANELVFEFIRTQKHMTYVDITTDANFTDNWDWYLNDGLHLNNLGHVKLGEVLRPAIQALEKEI